MLRLEDRYLWDFWFCRDGGDIHVFFLQAPRDLPSPDDRHLRATIGHAVSSDLRSWRLLPDALGPGPAGAWDASATWTGSVVRDPRDGRWWLFYTGARDAAGYIEQAIGAAVSDDLLSWSRPFEGPRVSVDRRWYEPLDAVGGRHASWRDPWVFRDGDDGDWHMMLTARVPTGPPDGRGVIGHARSADLEHWEVLPPLTDAGEFAHLECPQLVPIDGSWYLFYSVYEWAHSQERRRDLPAVRGTHYRVADQPLGPFTTLTDRFLSPAEHLEDTPDLYAGKVVDDPAGGLAFMGFSHDGPEGVFVGELADPVPIDVGSDGRLRLRAP